MFNRLVVQIVETEEELGWDNEPHLQDWDAYGVAMDKLMTAEEQATYRTDADDEDDMVHDIEVKYAKRTAKAAKGKAHKAIRKEARNA